MIRGREEHLAWAKKRALEYVDTGDLNGALVSMISDLGKHRELGCSPMLMQLGLMRVKNRDMEGVRAWVNGFN